MAVQKSQNNKDALKAPKAEAGQSARRPSLPKENILDTQKMIRVARTSLSKKSKSNMQELPDGVLESLRNKERIKEALSTGVEKNSINELKSKYDAVGTPLNHKQAKIMTAERNIFFAENRAHYENSSKKRHGSRLNSAKKPSNK